MDRPTGIKAEDKGFRVLESLMRGDKIFDDLVRETRMNERQVRQGIAWLRDYDPGCLVVQRHGTFYHYRLAQDAAEVADYHHGRCHILLRMATRLGKMVSNAVDKWPDDRYLRTMDRHLTRLREDLEDIEVGS